MLDDRLEAAPSRSLRLAPINVNRLAGAVLAYAMVAMVLAPHSYLALLPSYLQQASLVPLLMLVGLPVVAMVRTPKAPLTDLLVLLRSRGVFVLATFAVFSLGITGFSTFKLQIPAWVPFYMDPLLARLDTALHGGQPGLYAHAILPTWAQWGLAYVYGKIWLLQWFGMLLVVAFLPPGRRRDRYLLANALTTCLVGTVLALLMSSVGPIFYADFYPDSPFEALMASAHASAAGGYLKDIAHYLMAGYAGETGLAGTGISAMPSMHVAIATLNALFLAGINRWLGLAGALFVAIILFGSVYLGWHYALDGYVSIAVVSGVWWLSGRLVPINRDQPA